MNVVKGRNLEIYLLWPVYCAEGIKCVKVFLFLQVSLVEIESFGLYLLCLWESDHHVVDDVVMFGQSHVTANTAHHSANRMQCLLGTNNWIVGHIINLSIDVLLLIATSEKVWKRLELESWWKVAVATNIKCQILSERFGLVLIKINLMV